MDDKDTTSVPDNDTSPLAVKLQRIGGYERGRLPIVPRVIQWVGAHAGVRRLLSLVRAESRSLAAPQDAGPGSAADRFPGTAPYYYGRQVGAPRVMPLVYVRDGDDFVVVGTNFGQRQHPGWTVNLLAHADASIEVGPEQLPVTGELADPATWQRLWPRFVALYPGYADYLTVRAEKAAHVPAAPVRLAGFSDSR